MSSLTPIAGSNPPCVGLMLNQRLEQQVFTPARSIGADLSVTAVTELPPATEVRPSPRGTWWVASTFEADPVALSNGCLTYAPAEVIANLRALRAAGVDFELIYILNELPGNWTPGTPPPRMQLVEGAEASVVRTQQAVFAAGLEALRASAKVAGIAARGLATAGAVAAVGIAEAIVLDPIVLGGVHDPESSRVAWVTLAAWDEVAR